MRGDHVRSQFVKWSDLLRRFTASRHAPRPTVINPGSILSKQENRMSMYVYGNDATRSARSIVLPPAASAWNNLPYNTQLNDTALSLACF